MWIGDYLFFQKWPYGFSRFCFPFQFPSFDGRIAASLPCRGDIVIFRPPGREQEDWVKRVIGLPGDRIAVRQGQVVLNGRAVAREALGTIAIPLSRNSPCLSGRVTADGTSCAYRGQRETLPGGPSYTVLNLVDGGQADEFAETLVPAGHVFVMGDNRDNSLDSRFSPAVGGVGLLPVDHLVGRATVRFWSTDGSASWINPLSWFGALRADRVGKSYNQ
jgi:signal peptidase I